MADDSTAEYELPETKSTDRPLKYESITNMMNKDDMTAIVKEQKAMLCQLEKTNQMLLNCNNISERQYGALANSFQRHTAMLRDMKRNLHSIHTRIRHLKSLLQEKHPESWSVVEQDGNIHATSLLDRNSPSINEQQSKDTD